MALGLSPFGSEAAAGCSAFGHSFFGLEEVAGRSLFGLEEAAGRSTFGRGPFTFGLKAAFGSAFGHSFFGWRPIGLEEAAGGRILAMGRRWSDPCLVAPCLRGSSGTVRLMAGRSFGHSSKGPLSINCATDRGQTLRA